MGLKQRIFVLLDERDTDKNGWNRIINTFIIILILASVTSIILESFQPLHDTYADTFYYFELFTVVIFSTEYILRIWIADLRYPNLKPVAARTKFIFSAMGIVDLLAILPFYLPLFLAIDMRFVRLLRVLRLLRILKLKRHSKALTIVANVLSEKRSELFVTVLVTAILLLLSATVMYNIEHDVQPENFPDIITTLWWAVATLTTVGYGDVYPITGWGRFVGGIIALIGVGLVALPTGIISASFIEALEEDQAAKAAAAKEKQQAAFTETFNYCPHCGKPLREETH